MKRWTDYICPECGDPVLSGSVIGGGGRCVAHPEPVEPVAVEVVPLSEVKEALLAEVAQRAAEATLQEAERLPTTNAAVTALSVVTAAIDAAFPAPAHTEEKGEGQCT